MTLGDAESDRIASLDHVDTRGIQHAVPLCGPFIPAFVGYLLPAVWLLSSPMIDPL
jgi:hypothetical protein